MAGRAHCQRQVAFLLILHEQYIRERDINNNSEFTHHNTRVHSMLYHSVQCIHFLFIIKELGLGVNH